MKLFCSIFLAAFLALPVFAKQSDLVATWRSKDGKETMEFTADGHVRSLAGAVGVSGKYECKEDIILLKFEGDGAPPVIERKYKVIGDVLKIEDMATHQVTEFRRDDKKKG
jgi:hypothetical protein